MGRIDDAGRQIAGLLTYNPGPGIYSRLERAVQAMPENVRVQELPGLLKRYKEGVPGWELKATDLDSVIAGRDVVPRDELLAKVREASPVYTHKEIVLGGAPQLTRGVPHDVLDGTDRTLPFDVEDVQPEPSAIGRGVHHGDTAFHEYGQGGQDYAELLLTQPDAGFKMFGSHWNDRNAAPGASNAVAHARYDTHGDALRINELQSDLGIHNRKAREYAAQNPQTAIVDGQHVVQNDPAAQGLPFPLEDACADILIKRLALEAARQGHRAIEVASPRAIADKVGGNIDNYEHFYGKVVPGALERLGRKMGGLVDDNQVQRAAAVPDYRSAVRDATAQRSLNHVNAVHALATAANDHSSVDAIRDALDSYNDLAGQVYRLTAPGREQLVGEAPIYFRQVNKEKSEDAQRLFEALAKARARGMSGDWDANLARARQEVAPMMPSIMRHADLEAALSHSREKVADISNARMEEAAPAAGRRYLMSDEMRRRLIEGGIGASLLAPIVGASVGGQPDGRD